MFRKGISKSALKALGVIEASKLGKQFYLAGGTAAAIQLGHRLSLDLDYFSRNVFSGEELIKKLEAGGVNASKLEPAEGTLHCIIEGTKVSFLHYEYPLLQDTKRFEQIDLASLLDIALMKITAIASRGLKKDFVDLYFILQEISLQQMLKAFSEKYPIAKLDPYHYLRSLTYFDDAENDPMPLMHVDCDWEGVKAFLEKSISKLSLV
ncbi:nucleotidyl transferase AbiEii/AbiGii toxin family protein [Oligoflexia bacterium]|nr:nucleotidyl transferase AbiEii/AbiGii toxin family protein [Oligoflexia bacterium]